MMRIHVFRLERYQFENDLEYIKKKYKLKTRSAALRFIINKECPYKL